MIQIKELLIVLFVFSSCFTEPTVQKESPIIICEPKLAIPVIEEVKDERISRLAEFIKIYNTIDDDEHIQEVAESFIKLFDMEHKKDWVRFYIALCSVESNFRMIPNNSGSSAFGISQVIYRYHDNYITQLGVNKDNFYNSVYHNIYAGYKVFWTYSKNANGIKAGTFKYRGREDILYYQKIYKRYQQLLNFL